MLGTIYRASYTDTLKNISGECKLEENIRKASEISSRLIINGDFNIDMSDQNKPETKTLSETYNTYGLTQHISKPTRINTETGRPTLIDHVWANNSFNVIKKAGTFTGVSDHFGTYMILHKPKEIEKSEKIKCRIYKKYNAEDFKKTSKIP